MYLALHKALNKLVYVDELRLFRLAWADADRSFLAAAGDWTARALAPAEVERFGGDAATGLHQPYLAEAQANGDQCFALLDGERLASYSWYSQKPTILTGAFRLTYPSRYVYMHHSFTPEGYRGRRLHTIGIVLALRDWAQRGHEEFLCVVSGDNTSSLKSTGRAGYRLVGRLWMAGARNHYVYRANRGCRRLGCYVLPSRPGIRFTALESRRFVA